MSWQKTRKWIIAHYEEKPESAEAELIWLKKKIKAGEKINWSFVDTVDYHIDAIPRKRELLLDFKGNLREVRACQHLLSLKKAHSRRMEKNMITR